MKDYKDKTKNNLYITNKINDELKNEIINYTVFNTCISLLSGVQIKCLGKKEKKKKKEKDETNVTCFKQIQTIHNTFKKNYLEDYEMFNISPKKAFHSESAYNAVSFYKKKNQN
ncbi:conserved Plasmodium protein, unknown function [Plasmodium berghei]|uniref:Uncharacterized protein n=2 Tax=Plasmodium berghei TaxID=5821 RepID=A0A509AFW2_PLABA|nr:conserved Plasmodium protein, unknown function [Plasmodium berghei ANKA]CXI10396.1 conserved Plasmodium protein, unknown function [Plasmodium berghei]SCL93011.1 conserved Plasmodium protein, unknown function [Plasmodium berghei]SCM15770.1 conserved Plasmodium protein, unknown function [Plasmodium berghei]SCM17565.1 conserved Plasmodium protein, unknown function [Plasmodium berghei]SCN23016.1 conserved Plasmodium protein, unknown function [Plasmodium berghei]|eukprot:XP_034420376.1 conserved Plasmodium protein, unknown function [Plasmodium berghei ANKA]